MSKAKTAELPDLDRDFIETRLLEAEERTETENTLTKRNKARAEVKLLQELLDASR